MEKVVELIGAGFGLGTPKATTAEGPEFFAASPLGLKSLPSHFHWQPLPYDVPVKPGIAGREGALSDTAAYCRMLAEAVGKTLKKGHFPCVIGGDHSIAMGTWSGVTSQLKSQHSFGLIWIDAHMDSHTFETTPSQAIHGMPLAALMGYGDSSLVNIGSEGPKLAPQHVVLIGVRSFEEGEAELLKSLNVRIIFRDEVKRRGFDACFDEALQIVQKGTKGFGVTIDLDAFDPQEIPGVGTPAPDGLHPHEVRAALSKLSTLSLFQALEIVEFNPIYDKGNKSLKLLAELIKVCLIKK